MNITEIAALAKARLAQLEQYQDYPLEDKLEEQEKARKAKMKADTACISISTDISSYKRVLGLPTDPVGSYTAKEIEEKIRAVMPQFAGGANGKEIADAIFMYGIGSDTISDAYWKDGQTYLKKAKNAKEEVAGGLDTKYLLAKPEDKEEIEADKKAEEAVEAKRKAKREAKKK